MRYKYILILLLSSIFTQNIGMLKTNKNKSGLGFFVTSTHEYKGDDDGQMFNLKPDRINYQISYRMKSNIDVYINASPGEVQFSNSNQIDKYFNTTIGSTYNYHQKKWGSSISIQKSKWESNTTSTSGKEYIDQTGKTSISLSLFSKTKYHPYVSLTNVFNNNDNSQYEIFTIGGIIKINKFITHWGWNIVIYEELELLKDNANFFIGAGIEIF